MKMERILIRCFCVLFISAFTIIAAFSLFMSAVTPDISNEKMIYQADNLLTNILWLALLIFISVIIVYACKKLEFKGRFIDVFAFGIALLVTMFSAYWVFASNTEPIDDQFMSLACAHLMNMGEYGCGQNAGYVCQYPHQLGFITFCRIMFILFGDMNYRSIQIFNALMTFFIVFGTYKIAKYISKDSIGIEIISLICVSVCAPLYIYVPYVYGEIPSIAFLIIAGWMLLRYFEKKNTGLSLLIFCLMCALAVMFRKNSEIMLIGFAIALFLDGLSGNLKKSIGIIALMVFGVFILNFAVKAAYYGKNMDLNHGTPAIMWISMGTNDDNYYNPGSFNGLMHVYTWYNGDLSICNSIAKEELKVQLLKFVSDPIYFFSFYIRKLIHQWEAPMFLSLTMNRTIAGSQGGLAMEVYWGSLRQIIERAMNVFQSFVYFSGVFFVWNGFKKRIYAKDYVMLIGIFGGVLFSLLWEAMARYVFPYFVFLIPYAAAGAGELSKIICINLEKIIIFGKKCFTGFLSRVVIK